MGLESVVYKTQTVRGESLLILLTIKVTNYLTRWHTPTDSISFELN